MHPFLQWLQTVQPALLSGDQGTISSNWLDRVSYGKQLDYREAKFATWISQRRFLDPDDGYTATATIELAKDDVGSYFVFIKTDSNNYVSVLSSVSNYAGCPMHHFKRFCIEPYLISCFEFISQTVLWPIVINI